MQLIIFSTKSLAASIIMLIFAASNQISDQKSLLQKGSVFHGHTTSWEKYNLTATAWGSGNTPKVSANLNLTARSAVSFYCQMSYQISNIKQNVKTELWQDIPGYEGLYRVSNFGRILSLNKPNGQKGRLKKLHSHHGYWCVTLSKNGVVRNMRVHRLVAKAFVSGYKEGLVVNHKDENKKNNRFDNLEWISQEENLNYGTARERSKKNHCCRPIEMYDLEGTFLRSFQSIKEAERFLGVQSSHSNISNCCRGFKNMSLGYRWRYVDSETKKSNKSKRKEHSPLELPNEVWRSVYKFEGLYQVSNYGRIRAIENNIPIRIVKQCVDSNGYYSVSLRKDGKQKAVRVHRLVALAFVKGYSPALVVNHKDENKLNNNFNNLEWVTVEYNNRYGEKPMICGRKSQKQVLKMSLDGNPISIYESVNSAAASVGISRTNITECCHGRQKTAGGYMWKFLFNNI